MIQENTQKQITKLGCVYKQIQRRDGMNKSESIASLSKALVLAQSEFPKVSFNSTNPYFNSSYADLGAVIETSKPILKNHGLAVSQLVEGASGEVGNSTLLIHETG